MAWMRRGSCCHTLGSMAWMRRGSCCHARAGQRTACREKWQAAACECLMRTHACERSGKRRAQ
eukprot:3720505-Pleurochrysis_carterae.AAC.1